MKKMVLYTALAVCSSAAVYAGDWPQFCGPERNNVSDEKDLAESWPEGGPKELWKMEVGDGYSSPAIKDGKVYFLDHAEGKSILRCLDLTKGTELWKVEIDDPGTMSHKDFAGTRGTPAVSDDSVYFSTGWGTLVCVDLESKAVKWKHDLLEEFGMDLHMWGMSQSPLLYKDMVIVAPTAEKVGVVAYNSKDGKEVWKSGPIGGYAFASPAVYTICGEEMLVALGAEARSSGGGGRSRRTPAPAAAAASTEAPKSGVYALSLKDGSTLWNYGGWQCRNAIPFPISVPGDRLFISGGYGAGAVMLRIEKSEEGYKTTELFKTDKISPQIHQPVLVEDHLFAANFDGNLTGLICADLDGKVIWQSKDVEGGPKVGRGPFIVAGDKIILLDADTGKLHLVKVDTKEYKELASASVVKADDMAWAPLALSDGKLIVRDWTTLKCVDLK